MNRALALCFFFVAACGGTENPTPEREPPTADQILATSWQILSEAPNIAGKQDDVYFVDPDVGYSVNGLGQIFGTTDGGDTWTRLLDQPGTYFRAITFVDAKHGFAANIGTGYYPGVTDARPLFVTHDGGLGWQEVTSITGPKPKGICGFSRIDESRLVATGRVGGPSYFLASQDGGDSWFSTDITNQIAMLVDSHFVSPATGFVTGGSSTDADSHCLILRTRDGGVSWEEAFRSSAAGEMCWKMSFPSSRVGYAAVLTFGDTASSFVRTQDGGDTWEELPLVDGPYAALGIGFITEDIGWVGGEALGQPAYRTRDRGASWEPDASLGPYINRFRFVGPRTGYAIGTTIYKLSVP